MPTRRRLCSCATAATMIVAMALLVACRPPAADPKPSSSAPLTRAGPAAPSPTAINSTTRAARTPENNVGLANRLASASSPYLRQAATQSVLWQPFDDRAFQIAQALDRPVLLDVGATWCHWCRVMGVESYADPAIAALINENFVPIRVDADERPDLDRHYQRAAQLIAHEAGWPLTLLLNSAGEPFAGGTYFPALDIGVRPSLKTFLSGVATTYRDDPAAISYQVDRVAGGLAALQDAGVVRGTLEPALVDDLAEVVRGGFDPVNGGFGSRAKFPAPQAVELALRRYAERGEGQDLTVAVKTLDGMAAGGIRDQLGGAFHRYTLDPRWQVPHFEVMGTLDGALAVAYLHAYQATAEERFRVIAEGVLDYLNRVLVDPHGGFYSSQDADVSPGDDGGYYTWTEAQLRAALTPDEAAAALVYFGFTTPYAGSPSGEPPSGLRNVLHAAVPIAEVARILGLPADQTRARLEAARAHLRAARADRQAPLVDRTFFSDRNGTLASAYLAAYQVLRDDNLRTIALRAVARLMDAPRSEGLVAHAYGERREVAPGMLDDQIAVAASFLDAFAVTGDHAYLAAAGQLLDRTIAVFGDPQRGGFFDLSAQSVPEIVVGRQKPFDDAMTLGGNPLAAMTFDRAAAFTGNTAYRAVAGETLRAFAGAAREYGPFAAGYALALDYHLSGNDTGN